MAWNLFVCGCGRSGTTAMWRLLSQSPEIVIGMERFVHSMMWGKLSPHLYTEERFFTQGERETWYDITKGEEGAYMPIARERWKKARYIGDKLPTLENYFDQLLTFSGGRIIYMVRNIYDVAASYKRRRDTGDPTWTAGGVDEAIVDWNKSLNSALSSPHNFGIRAIDYDRFYRGDGYVGLWSWLELKQQGVLNQAHAKLRTRAMGIMAQPRNLTEEELSKIHANADFDAYNKIMSGQIGMNWLRPAAS